MFYYLAPYTHDEIDDSYHTPVGTIGAIDLRSPLSGEGVGFFACEVDLPDLDLVGTSLDGSFTAAHKTIWQGLVGTSPDAATLLDALFWQLTIGADPTGSTACKPLIPNRHGEMNILLAGQEYASFVPKKKNSVKNVRLRSTDPHFAKVCEVHQHDYRQCRAECLECGSDHYRKQLGFWVRKYGVSADAFIPSDLPVESALPPTTTYTEDFNKADNGLGPDLTWTEVGVGGWGVTSNQGTHDVTVMFVKSARAEHDLSGDDMTCEATVTVLGTQVSRNWNTIGVGARFNSSGEDLYAFRAVGNNRTQLNRYDSGSGTALDNTGSAISANDVIKIEVDGSDITGYINDVEDITATDTNAYGLHSLRFVGKRFW